MPRFVSLLDPRRIVVSNSGTNLEQRAREAQARFPSIVAESALSLWRPGMPVPNLANRYLVGVAVTFAVGDLRFLDVVNDCILQAADPNLIVQTFDLDDTSSSPTLEAYYPGLSVTTLNWNSHPLVGRWEYGQFAELFVGTDGISELLGRFRSPLTAAEILQSVNPFDPKVLD